jgi:hypothetical protein
MRPLFRGGRGGLDVDGLSEGYLLRLGTTVGANDVDGKLEGTLLRLGNAEGESLAFLDGVNDGTGVGTAEGTF